MGLVKLKTFEDNTAKNLFKLLGIYFSPRPRSGFCILVALNWLKPLFAFRRLLGDWEKAQGVSYSPDTDPWLLVFALSQILV